jgi:hypothetical protein
MFLSRKERFPDCNEESGFNFSGLCGANMKNLGVTYGLKCAVPNRHISAKLEPGIDDALY